MMLHTTLKQSLFLALTQVCWCQAREEEILHYPVSSKRYTVKEEIQKAPEEILHNTVSSDRLTTREEMEKAPEEILHYPVSSGKYTVKEEIQRAPAENHLCNLTRTSVKISFPEMRSEVFVNFLGYKEPNLIHLPCCKGLCGKKDNA